MPAVLRSPEDLEARYAPALKPYDRPLAPEELMAEAERGTGLSDWGGPEFQEQSFRERLGLLCSSLESEAAMNANGRSRVHSRIYFNLCGRLGVVDWHRRNPSPPAITGPLVGTGMGRSGTSFFHQLLAQDPENLTAPMGECMIPTPPPGDAAMDKARLAVARRLMDFAGTTAPEIEAVHPFAPENAAECGALQASAIGTEYQAFWSIPTFLQRAHADIADLFKWEIAVMQTLQSGKSGQRWLLKTPEHLGHWDAMVAAFPTARVFINHRDPAKTIPSGFSMIGIFGGLTSDRRIDPKAIAQQAVKRMDPLNHVTAWRKAHPEAKVVDVHYKTMIADPIGEAERVYAEFGLSLSRTARERMEAFVKTNRHAHGPKHSYSLADFGLTEADIEAVFGDYLDAYGIERERG